MSNRTTAAQQNTIYVRDAELQKVETQNGFDYYAIWTEKTDWVEGTWVRVLENATPAQVEDALYRGELVSSL